MEIRLLHPSPSAILKLVEISVRFDYKGATMCGLSRMFCVAFGLQVLAGCAGLTASISASNVSGAKIDRTAQFFLLVPEAASADDRKVVQALADELRFGGLKVASEPSRSDAGYVVAVAFTEKSSATTGSLPLSQAQFSTIRNVNGLPVGVVQTGSTSDVPYAWDYRVRTVRVSLFGAERTGDPLRLVWEGSIASEAKALSSHSRCIVRELVKRLGAEFNAQTRIDIACRSR